MILPQTALPASSESGGAPRDRRSFLRWAARGAVSAASATSVASGVAEAAHDVLDAPAPLPLAVPAGTMFQMDRERWCLQADPSRLVRVPRWEWEELADEPQPQPIKVEVETFKEEPAHQSMIVRYWAPGAIDRCRLCAVCNAIPVKGKGPEYQCYTFLGRIATEADALYSERGA